MPKMKQGAWVPVVATFVCSRPAPRISQYDRSTKNGRDTYQGSLLSRK
jgi:hypothetical protein